MSRNTQFLPQVSFAILLALCLRPRHGYEIMKQIEEDTAGRLRIGPGGLYTSVKKLQEAGYVEETEGDGNERRRYYRLTQDGMNRLEEEMAHYEQMVDISRRRFQTQKEAM